VFTRPSRAEQEREQARIHLARAQVLEATNAASHQLREKVAPAVAVAARDARDWAVPKAAEAKAWAGPKAHDARVWATPHVERGLEVAGPKVEAVVEKLTPAVDAARDRIVDELLPRVVEAVNAASVAAAGATAATGVAASTAKKRSVDAAAVLRGEAIATRPRQKRSKGKFLLVLSLLAAAGGAAFAAFKRQSPQEDPWAVPPGSYSTESSAPSSAPSSSAPGAPSDLDDVGAGDPLASGDASDALGGTGNSLADPGVPGLTTDSSPSGATATGDPLTDPIEDVEGGPNNTGGRA